MTTTPAPATDLVASIDQVRSELRVPYAALANAAGVSTPTIWRLLTGRSERPNPRLVAACLIHLGRVMERRAAA